MFVNFLKLLYFCLMHILKFFHSQKLQLLRFVAVLSIVFDLFVPPSAVAAPSIPPYHGRPPLYFDSFALRSISSADHLAVPEYLKIGRANYYPSSLSGIKVIYKNSDHSSREVFAFPAGAVMTGSYLYLVGRESLNDESSSPNSYSAVFNQSSGRLELLDPSGKILDSFCWGGEACEIREPLSSVPAWRQHPTLNAWLPELSLDDPSSSGISFPTPLSSPSPLPKICPPGTVFNPTSSRCGKLPPLKLKKPLSDPELTELSRAATNLSRTLSSLRSTKPAKISTCKNGYILNPLTGRCQKMNPLQSCAAGKYRDPVTNRCRSIALNSVLSSSSAKSNKSTKSSSQQSHSKSPTSCKPGYERNPETNRCRKVKLASVNSGAKFPITKVESAPPSKKTFIAFSAIVIILALGIIYLIFQFRAELKYFIIRRRERVKARKARKTAS